MAIITGYTSARMDVIENSAIIDGEIITDNLWLEPKGFATAPGTYPKIDAGNVRGPTGATGPTGEVTTAAMNAAIAVAHGTGAISTTQLANGSVTTIKIGDDQVTTAKIAPNAVDTDEIATDAITSAKIAANQVTGNELANNAVDTLQIAADAVESTKIANNAILTEHYGDESIYTGHIADNQISDAKMANSAKGTSGSLRYSRMGDVVHLWTEPTGVLTGVTVPIGYRPSEVVIGHISALADPADVRIVRITTAGAIERWTGSWSSVIGAQYLNISYTT